MEDFNDVSAESTDFSEADISETNEWGDFDDVDTNISDGELGDTSDISPYTTVSVDQSEAQKAADYARSFGYEKAADYISRHFEGDKFVPGDPIQIGTRNQSLEGTTSENGVSFERRTAELTDGLTVEGVFPEFDSIHHVELGEKANDMSVYQQFNACKENLQDTMCDNQEFLQTVTVGEMDRLNAPQGYTPEGYTWQHNPETGSFDLVSQDDHSVGHTGGNALWGR